MSKLFLLIGLCLSSFVFAATEIKTTSDQGDVQFEAIGKPSMLKIKGKGEAAVANLKLDGLNLNGDIQFKLATLNTGIDLRDEHMKEKYLQVKEHPEAILTFKDFTLPAGWSVKNAIVKSSPFTATLKLHGIEKPVTGTFEIENEKLATKANFEIKLSDFGIDIPTYLGVKVADTVKIAVNFTAMVANEVAAAAPVATPAPSAPAPVKNKKK